MLSFQRFDMGGSYVLTPTPLPTNQWTKVKITQVNPVQDDYKYELSINDEPFHSQMHTAAKEYTNVKVYASNPWYNPAQASIRNLKIRNLKSGSRKFQIIRRKERLIF